VASLLRMEAVAKPRASLRAVGMSEAGCLAG
jgi:hypothetical protein